MKLRIPNSYRQADKEPTESLSFILTYVQDNWNEPRGAVESVRDDVTKLRDCFARFLDLMVRNHKLTLQELQEVLGLYEEIEEVK